VGRVFRGDPLPLRRPPSRPDPGRRTLDAARTGGFMEAEWEAYERSCMAEQDARGAITFAQR
jgi:hypothetical protein